MGKKWNILYVYSFGYKTLYATKAPIILSKIIDVLSFVQYNNNNVWM
jgi:hypothetical protein